MRAWVAENLHILIPSATSLVAILVSAFMTGRQLKMARHQYEAQQQAMKEDREAAKEERETEKKEREVARRTAQRDRFIRAMNQLDKGGLNARISALNELKSFGLDELKDQKEIIWPLELIIENGIGEKELLVSSKRYPGRRQPNKDVFIACKVVSSLNCRVAPTCLIANELDLHGLQLQGANLIDANFQGAKLCYANLQRTNFSNANLEGADLHKADLRGAENLTAKQLLKAQNVEFAILDSDLEAEYERLKTTPN